ncbi:MAG: methionine--tRNA ligase [Myxococcota bacterium]
MPAPFYVTTPIYYPNAAPHLGTAYTTTYADTLVRYHRLAGEDAFFITGTDEHGEKLAEAAAAQGLAPQVFVDRMAERFREQWGALGLEPRRFVRTTDPAHVRAVQHFWQTLYDKGEIELRDYEGQYCVGCEEFKTERDLVDGKCPNHPTRAIESRRERNYFFRTAHYFDWLAAELRANPALIEPERYRNEVLAMLRDGGVGDLCISRPVERLSWGIPLPFDERFVAYVWADALITYLTAVGYPDDPDWTRAWSGSHHLIAKEILKFHGVFWPIMLHAAGIPLYGELRVHGYWTLGGQKISKSATSLVDALGLKDVYGFEALRYFMLREMSFGVDAEFSEEALIARLNADLANDLGNLVSRSLGMLGKYFAGRVPEGSGESGLRAIAARVAGDVDRHVRAFSTQRALASLWELVGAANKYVDSSAPWVLAKDRARERELATVMYELFECIRVIGCLLAAFMPETSAKILDALGAGAVSGTLAQQLVWGGLAPGAQTRKPESLFPRIEVS